VVIEVSVASLDTDNQRRDDHLRSADFFEVERWPTARVRVHNISQTTPGRYQADFEVQIRDKIKTIRGEFEVIDRSTLTVHGTLTIDRTDFGIGDPKNWNPMSIGNEIPITFEVSLRR
jgi:polyisoprenoid-binding protein YceI